MAWTCTRYNVLPEPGGLRDQIAGEVDKMDAALSTYRGVKVWNDSNGKRTNAADGLYTQLDHERNNAKL